MRIKLTKESKMAGMVRDSRENHVHRKRGRDLKELTLISL